MTDVATRSPSHPASCDPRGSNVSADPRPAAPPAPETRRLYQADWAAFAAWCRRMNVPPLPAEPSSVAAFLADGATRLSLGALSRRAAAIAAQHRALELVSPTSDRAVKAVLRQARQAAAPRRRPRPSPAQLDRMATRCLPDAAGQRDRALLLLAASTQLGRAALLGLDAETVRFTADGMELGVVARAGDAARIVPVTRLRAAGNCPVRAMEDWLRLSDTRYGPVFRKVTRWGSIEHGRLGTDAIRRILQRHGARRPRHGSDADATS